MTSSAPPDSCIAQRMLAVRERGRAPNYSGWGNLLGVGAALERWWAAYRDDVTSATASADR